jgi:hypothetical protein
MLALIVDGSPLTASGRFESLSARGERAGDLTQCGRPVGYMATSTQRWMTPIVLYLRRAHLWPYTGRH